MVTGEGAAYRLESTAYWTAAVRAQETAREARLIDDPWAAALAGSEGAAWIAERPAQSVVPIVLRTHYFDECLQRITAEDGLRQVVLMAAGLDTRAFRLRWPAQTRLFELDQPAVLQYKAQVLGAAGARPACDRQTIEADLTEPWDAALLQSGFSLGQPAAWLLEGFLFYLATERLEQLLDQVAALAAPGSWLGFDCVNSAVLTSPLTRPWVEMQVASGAPWIGTLDDPVAFLAARDWQVTLTQAGQPDANHGRWALPVIPTLMPNMPHNWFVTAWKR